MTEIRPKVLLCEDYRIDQQGLPILIGLMPPSAELHGEKEQLKVCIVTVITAPATVPSVATNLRVTFENVSGEDARDRYYESEMEQPASNPQGVDWMNVKTLELKSLFFEVGSKITIEFKGPDFAVVEHFTMLPHSNDEDELAN